MYPKCDCDQLLEEIENQEVELESEEEADAVFPLQEDEDGIEEVDESVGFENCAQFKTYIFNDGFSLLVVTEPPRCSYNRTQIHPKKVQGTCTSFGVNTHYYCLH